MISYKQGIYIEMYYLQLQTINKHTLAKSIGWITQLANVAAEPPHTNGCAIAANPPLLPLLDMILVRWLVYALYQEV